MRDQGGLGAGLWSIVIPIAIAVGVASMLTPSAVLRFESWELGAWIYSFVVAFAINDAVQRKSNLKENIEIELNTLRHLTQLIGHLGTASWRKNLVTSVHKYQLTIANSFPQYSGSAPIFRELSNSIYSYTPRNARESTVFGEVTATLRQLSDVREHIHHSMQSRIGWTQWIRLALVCVGLFTVLFLSKETVLDRRLAIAVSIFIFLLPFDLLFHSSSLSPNRIRYFESRYRKNR